MEAGTGRWGGEGEGRDAGRRVNLLKRGEELLRADGSIPGPLRDFPAALRACPSEPVVPYSPRADNRGLTSKGHEDPKSRLPLLLGRPARHPVCGVNE